MAKPLLIRLFSTKFPGGPARLEPSHLFRTNRFVRVYPRARVPTNSRSAPAVFVRTVFIWCTRCHFKIQQMVECEFWRRNWCLCGKILH